MGKIITSNKKNSKGKSKSSKANKTVIGVKDPIGVRIVFALFILFMILTFAVGIFSILLLSNTNEHDGVLYSGDKRFAVMSSNQGVVSSSDVGTFVSSGFYTDGAKVGFKAINKDGKTVVVTGTINRVEDAKDIFLVDGVTFNDGSPFFIHKSQILGKFEKKLDSPILVQLMINQILYTYVFAGFIALTFVLGLVHYLISPRGAKQHEKKEEVVVQTVTTVSSENSELLSHYLSTDDNIQMLDKDQNETGELLNINYYNSVRLHNGEVYAVVKKYQEAVRKLEEYGASDMDIIRMNMIGNSEFDDLILNTHKEKSMTMWEIIDYARGLDGVYCVKKRGTLNWTFKYKSKTLFIIKRDSDDSDSYKVSIKVYPDAATKLNIIYKALEDSSFPIGPYWYMFNDLRNLPANVIKWLISESLNISKWQQIKADLLRDTPDLASYKLDQKYMHDMILASTKQFDMGKFMIITQIDTSDEVKYDTVLKTGFEDIDMDQFTKEITMVVPGLKNVQMSLLTRKNASEALVTALCNELLDFNTKTEAAAPNPNDLNNIIKTPTTTTVVKKSGKKKK